MLSRDIWANGDSQHQEVKKYLKKFLYVAYAQYWLIPAKQLQDRAY